MSNPRSPKVLGIAASLRNARWGMGNRKLIDELVAIESKEALLAYLQSESQLHLEAFLEAGRRDGKDFLEIYGNLRRRHGDSGLSNSEVALAAALWAAQKEGADIDHVSLSEHFTASGEVRRPEVLRAKLLEADGLLLSGPVYFGDRGSLAESLIEFIACDQALRNALCGRIYAGISVGAKRNGGQETSLIYQMLDLVNLGLFAVGNDSDTTAQYGGTGHAGDVGTMHKDIYGLDTSMGAGRRIAKVLERIVPAKRLRDLPRVLFLVLQDADEIGAREVSRLATRFKGHMHSTVINMVSKRIQRCIACDICPTHIDVDDTYRCIIKAGRDDLSDLHTDLLHHDMIVPVGVSVRNYSRIKSNYQNFNERTRYLRRGDYIWSDLLVAPLVIEELGNNTSLSMRMMTSFLRHHTVMSKPMIEYLRDDAILNEGEIDQTFSTALRFATRLAAGRLTDAHDYYVTRYKPVGYVLSANKDIEDERMLRRQKMIEARLSRLVVEAEERLEIPAQKRVHGGI